MCIQHNDRYNSTTGNARYVEWEGTCQKGKCFICSTAPIPTAPVSYCNDGRVCVDNKFDYAVVGIFSWSFFFVNPLVMSFYIAVACLVVAIVILLYGVVAYVYYQRKYHRFINNEDDDDDQDSTRSNSLIDTSNSSSLFITRRSGNLIQ